MRETVLQDNRAHGHISLPRDQSPEADPDDSPRVLRLALERGGAVRLILDRISAGGREVGQPSAGYVAQGQLLAGESSILGMLEMPGPHYRAFAG